LLGHPSRNGAARETRGRGHGSDPASAYRHRLGRRPQPSHPLAHEGLQRVEFLPKDVHIVHGRMRSQDRQNVEFIFARTLSSTFALL
jgi:hypothetical protein